MLLHKQVVSGQTRQDEFERTLTAGQLISPFFSFCLCLLCVSSENPKLQKQYQIELPPPENNLSFQEKKRNYQLILHLVIVSVVSGNSNRQVSCIVIKNIYDCTKQKSINAEQNYLPTSHHRKVLTHYEKSSTIFRMNRPDLFEL